MLDTSNDGLLTLEEIKEGLTTVMGKVKGKQKIYEAILITLDKDCNGVIDYSEFLTAAVNKTKLLSKDNLRTAFNMMDLHHNGSITVDELKIAFEMSGNKKDDSLWT
jgi:calcium-dependent protein kinase